MISRFIIGISGASSVNSIGSVPDTKTFFECISIYYMKRGGLFDKIAGYFDVAGSNKDEALLERLYRRYVRFEDLEATHAMIKKIKQAFIRIKTVNVDWSKTSFEAMDTKLDLSKETLADVFDKYFESFDKRINEINYFFDRYGEYHDPLRFAISDIPYHVIDTDLTPLSKYDELKEDELPLWARPRAPMAPYKPFKKKS